MKSEEVYLQNVLNLWKKELNTTESVYILSPYLSLEVVKKLIKDGLKHNNYLAYEIYTLLSFENFLHERSSIKALKFLVEEGYDIYSLPDLNANIILVSDKFVSIGSQSLDSLDSQNKEATFTSTNSEVVNNIEKEIKEKWLNNSNKITLEKIEEIEKSLELLKPIYKMMQSQIAQSELAVDRILKQKADERSEIRSQNEERKTRLKKNCSNLAFKTIGTGQVKKIENIKTFVLSDYPQNQIIERNAQVSLSEYQYYLAILKNSGKLAWARVSNQRITQFRYKLEDYLSIGEYIFSFSAKHIINDSPSPFLFESRRFEPLANLEITVSLKNFNHPICKIEVWFDLQTLEIVNIKKISKESAQIITSLSNTNFVKLLEEIEIWILEHKEDFDSKIINCLMNPRFDKKLDGEEIDYFLSSNKHELKIIRHSEIELILIFNEFKRY